MRLLPTAISVFSGLAMFIAVVVTWLRGSVGPLLIAAPIVGGILILLAIRARRRWIGQLRWIESTLRDLSNDAAVPFTPPPDPELARVISQLLRLRRERTLRINGPGNSPSDTDPGQALSWTPTPATALTQSGLYESPSFEATFDPTASGDFSSVDMVNRLHPDTLRWLDSSPAEQDFLGYPLSMLRNMSFLDILHPDHRHLAREQLRGSIQKGEAHGLIYRIKTSRGEPKAIEMNVSVRFDSDRMITHLRCHVTDVTAKLQASRELRRRTRELAQANEDLVETNRALAELKDRFSDLYQNAPIMYYSLDVTGLFLECNNTLLQTLGYRRSELIGRHYALLLPEESRPRFLPRHAELIRTGKIEIETRWMKSDGTTIDVWVTGTAVMDPGGAFSHSRCVSRDVTARKALEAELQEKNARLGRANEELSRKNKELDEFTYVVSHDLQEPLRTLIAFSDFLMKDYGERLDDEGKEYVRFLVDASRRMRALINDLLSLSRAGKVTGEFTRINVEEVLETVRADLGERIRTSGAEVTVQLPLPPVWGDRNRLGQLFANLIGNGLKYNRSDHPSVVVGARDGDPGFAIFFVKDNGIGIDPQFHAKVFQIFRRLHARDEYEGTGAGLAICQKIVNAHGGKIWVESEAGRGSTFLMSLPKASIVTTTVQFPERIGAAHV